LTVRKRNHYPDDIKIAIYLELLAKTDPPVLHHATMVFPNKSLRSSVCLLELCVEHGAMDKMQVGFAGVKNKLVNCGRKRIEIDPEAIRAVPLRQHTTFVDLAEALGLKKSTLFNRYKERYFRRHTNMI
jgi:hypothetical protein